MSSRKLFAIVGCSKIKAEVKRIGQHGDAWIEAQDLYTSDLFKKRRAHVESRGLVWFIASAKSGLVTPTTPLRPYDRTMEDLAPIDVAAWHVTVVNQLIDSLYYDHNIRDFKEVAIELHAGSRYIEPLDKILEMFGAEVIKPVAGMGIGQQLAYYSEAVHV